MKIILGSGSPRRKYLLEEMGYSFDVQVSNTDESFDPSMDVYTIAPFLARQKANSLIQNIHGADVLICCDTVVIFQNTRMLTCFPMNIPSAAIVLRLPG